MISCGEFFKLIQSAILAQGNPLETEAVTEESLVALYKISKSHDLAHLIGHSFAKNKLLSEDSPAKKKFLQERNMAIYRYEQINYELEEICRIFEEEEIEHIPLKGSVLRRYYPEPWMRTSCDIDILVKKEVLEKAIKALENRGFRYEDTKEHDAHIWSASGVHLELHFDLMEASVAGKCADVIARAWERAKQCDGWKYRLEFDDAFFYFYHIAHMAKHFASSGCGIRLFLDIWILNQSKTFTKQGSEVLLEEAGLLKFAQNAEKLSNIWFGKEKHDEVTKEMEIYIVGAGIYGTLENQVALQQAKIGGKKKHVLSRIFMPYASLKISYPKLEKYPILYPFYLVVRWFKFIFRGNKGRAFRELKSIATTKDERKERLITLCNNLGIKK